MHWAETWSLDNPPLCLDSLVPGLEGSSKACCHDSRQLGPGMLADSVGGGLRNSSSGLLSVGDKAGGTQTEHAPLEQTGAWAWALGCPQASPPGWEAWLSCLKESEHIQCVVFEKDPKLGKEKQLTIVESQLPPQLSQSVSLRHWSSADPLWRATVSVPTCVTRNFHPFILVPCFGAPWSNFLPPFFL